MSPSRLVIGGYGSAIGMVELGSTGFGAATEVAAARRPSYVIASPDGRFVFATLENADGSVGSWAVGDTWRPLGEQPTGGADPCHLALSPDGRWLVTANYTSGSVCVHPVGSDGTIGVPTDLVQHQGDPGPVADRQDGPHAHQVVFLDDVRLLVCDLGLDVVVAYALNTEEGTLTEVARSSLPPGSGPRHLVLTADRRTAYVLGELSSVVSVCRVDGPDLHVLGTASARSEGAVGESTAAEIVLAADERRVIVSNRGDDTLSTLAVDTRTVRRTSTVPCGGSWPRWAGLAGTSDLLVVANERSDIVTALRRDGHGWVPTGSASWPQPTCLAPLVHRPGSAG